MKVEFADDFKDKENQLYIAVSGTPEDIKKRLLNVIKDIDIYSKPIQGIYVGSDSTINVITSKWNTK